MLNSTSIVSTLQSQKDSLRTKYGVDRLGLFGSYSRGEAIPSSDIDILVEFSKPIGLEFIDLAEELERLLGNRVDLVSRNGIKPKYFAAIADDIIYV